MEKKLTPSAIVQFLDQHVVGQAAAKRTLAVAVYTHFRKAARAVEGVEMLKSNVLLIGPTGSGKTLLCETLARGLKLPFVTADATSLAQSEWVNEEIETVLDRLLERAGNDVARAQRGIVFIDEVDKLKAIGGQGSAGKGERVQHALLKLMEGATVRLKRGLSIDTTHILFICGGMFDGLGEIMRQNSSFGFLATGENENQNVLDRLNARVKPTDLVEFGLIPEFTGRLPIVARLDELSHDMLRRIMTEPRNSIVRQFQDMLQAENVTLQIAPQVYAQIADLAIEYKAGARSLRGIFEEMMTPVLYAVPDDPGIRRVVIDSLFDDARFERGDPG